MQNFTLIPNLLKRFLKKHPKKLLLTVISNHLVCLQNTFENTYPESRSPKGSCHILWWFDVYILQNNITPGMTAADFRKKKFTSKK